MEGMPKATRKLILVETNEPGLIGSMKRYADLIEMGLQLQSGMEVSRVNLASKTSRWFRGPLKTLWHHSNVLRRSYVLRRSQPDAFFHVIDGSHGYVAKVLAKRCVVTVHDLIPRMQCDQRFPVSAPGKASRWIILQALQGLVKAGKLICVSSSTRNDLTEYLPQVEERATVILSPIEPTFFDAPVIEIEAILKSDAPYVFHIGNNGFYKNRIGVLRIFARISEMVEHRLVMAGPSPTEEMIKLVDSLGIGSRVDWLKNPSDEEVKSLYRHAGLFLFPSLYEGFGWPPVEAMASCCPVVCSNAGSLTEIVGSSALVGSAENELEMAKHCLEVLTNPAEVRRLQASGIERAKQFDLSGFSHRLMETYKTLIELL